MNVSRETYEKLELYEKLLLKWQNSVNLVSRETLNNIRKRHIEDSLQIIPYILGKKVIDIGSGGGFPGMVLAISGKFSVTCVDSDRKKMVFLSEVARITKTDVCLFVDRVENLLQNDFETVCARGFSKLSTLLTITDQLSSTKHGVFLKGANFENEIEEASLLFDFEYDIYPSKTDKRGRIIVVNSIQKR
jgi:16S rRNA (guanine527-N7)-methyltransferase